MFTIVLRWTDSKGNKQSREFKSEKEARKARDYLTERGCKDADIAVKLNR